MHTWTRDILKPTYGKIISQNNMGFYLYIYIYCLNPVKRIFGQVRRGIAPRKTERIKSRIGKVKKLKVMLQKRLKTVKNNCCGLGHGMWDCPYRWPKRVWLNVCTAPHHTAPGKTQYRTDENSRNLPTNSVPDPSINLMLEMGIVGKFLEMIVYMYVGSVR